MACLYRLTFPGGKSYIGITEKTVEKRFAEHVYNAKRGIDRGVNRAMRKYGASSVKVETLVIAAWDYLVDLERKVIKAFNTKAPHGYNWTDGGEGALGYKHTPESLLKMGAVHKGKAHHNMPHSAETKARMSAARKGRTVSEAVKARMRVAMMGNKYNLGKKASAETRAKQSAAHMGQKRTPEQRANISAAAKLRESIKRAEREKQ